MGKKKYEQIEKIEQTNSRNITYYKRIKGLVKKCIELSVLCQQDIFLFVADQDKKKILQYSNNSENDLLQLFNTKFDREFLSNEDYQKVGGDK